MYILRTDDGCCAKCGQDLMLLTDKEITNGYPAFSICFGCRDVIKVDGEAPETVVYRRGRRKQFMKVKKDPKAEPSAKMKRLQEHQRARREAQARRHQ
jgi:hypothetical protein